MSGFISGLENKLYAWLAYRAGQKSQKAADNAAELQVAQDAATIASRNSDLTDQQLRDRLRRPGTYGG